MDLRMEVPQDTCWGYHSLLSSKDGKTGFALSDVVLQRKNRLCWVSTSKRGKVLWRKSFEVPEILQAFARLAQKQAGNQQQQQSFCQVTWKDQSIERISREALASLLLDTSAHKGVDLVQPILPLGSLSIVVYSAATGPRVVSEARHVPGAARQVERMSWEVVRRMEENKGVKIASIELTFAVQGSGKVLLAQMDKIMTFVQPQQASQESQFLPEISHSSKESSSERKQLRCTGDFCGYQVDETAPYNILLLGSPETTHTPAVDNTVPKSSLILARAEMGYITGAVRQLESGLRDDSEFASAWSKLDRKLSIDLRRKSGAAEWHKEVLVCSNCHAIYSKISTLRANNFMSQSSASKPIAKHIEPAEHEFFSRQISRLEAEKTELLRGLEEKSNAISELSEQLAASESSSKEAASARAAAEKSWVSAMKDKDEECERLLLEVEALKHSLLSTTASNDTQDAIAYARQLEDAKNNLIDRLRQLNQRLASVEADKLQLEARLKEKTAAEGDTKRISSLLQEERAKSKQAIAKASNLEHQLRDAQRSAASLKDEQTELASQKDSLSRQVTSLKQELRTTQAELRQKLNKLTSDGDTPPKGKQSAELMQALNELDFARAQLASESRCKQDLSRAVEQAEADMAQLKAAAAQSEQTLRQSHLAELQAAKASFDKHKAQARKEAEASAEKLRLLQRNLHDLTQQLSTARRKVEALSLERAKVDQLESDNRALAQNVEELKGSVVQEVDAPVVSLRAQKAVAEAAARKSESEVVFWKNQAEIDQQMRVEAEAATANAQAELQSAGEKHAEEREKLVAELDAREAALRKALEEGASEARALGRTRDELRAEANGLRADLEQMRRGLEAAVKEADAKEEELCELRKETRAARREIEVSEASMARAEQISQASIDAMQETIRNLTREQEQQSRAAAEKLSAAHSQLKESARKLLALKEQQSRSEASTIQERILRAAVTSFEKAMLTVKGRAWREWRDKVAETRLIGLLRVEGAADIEEKRREWQQHEKEAMVRIRREHEERCEEIRATVEMEREELVQRLRDTHTLICSRRDEAHEDQMADLVTAHRKEIERIKQQQQTELSFLEQKKDSLQRKVRQAAGEAASLVAKAKAEAMLQLEELEDKEAHSRELAQTIDSLRAENRRAEAFLEETQNAAVEKAKEQEERHQAEIEQQRKSMVELQERKVEEALKVSIEEKQVALAAVEKSQVEKLKAVKEEAEAAATEMLTKHEEKIQRMKQANQECVSALVEEHGKGVAELEAKLNAALEDRQMAEKSAREAEEHLRNKDRENEETIKELESRMEEEKSAWEKEKVDLVAKMKEKKMEEIRIRAGQMMEEHAAALAAAKKQWEAEAILALEETKMQEEAKRADALKEAAKHWQRSLMEGKSAHEDLLQRQQQQHREETSAKIESLKEDLLKKAEAKENAIRNEAESTLAKVRKEHEAELGRLKSSHEEEKISRVEAALRDLQATHDRVLRIKMSHHEATLDQLRQRSETEKQAAVEACAKEAAGQMLAEMKKLRAMTDEQTARLKRDFEAREKQLLEECDAISEQRLQEAEVSMEQSVAACRQRFSLQIEQIRSEKQTALNNAANLQATIDSLRSDKQRYVQLSTRRLQLAGLHVFICRIRAMSGMCQMRHRVLSQAQKDAASQRQMLRSLVLDTGRSWAESHRSKIRESKSDLLATREEQKEVMKQEARSRAALLKAEAEVSRMEVELRELGRRSAMRPDGRVDEEHSRQKRTLDAALERALQAVTGRREERGRVLRRLRRLRERAKKGQAAGDGLAMEMIRKVLKHQEELATRLL